MSTLPQPRPFYGHALVAMLAVATVISLRAAEPATSSDPTTPAGPAVANGTAASTNGTQLPEEADIGQLQRFLSMPPERLEQMRKAIVYLENMPPGDLAALRLRMHSIEVLGQEIRGDIRALPKPEDRSVLGRYLMTLFPEDIQPLLKRFQEAKDKPEDRQVIVQEMLKKAVQKGIKPDPNATDRGTPPNGPRGGNRGRGPNGGPGRGEMPPPSPAAVTPASSN